MYNISLQSKTVQEYHIVLSEVEVADVLTDPTDLQKRLRELRGESVREKVLANGHSEVGMRRTRKAGAKTRRAAIERATPKDVELVTCAGCSGTFTRRGLKKHLHHCTGKLSTAAGAE